jgi:hypothetical protein
VIAVETTRRRARAAKPATRSPGAFEFLSKSA